MISLTIGLTFLAITTAIVVLASRAAYESAAYTVVEKDGNFEIRDYDDLMLVATDTNIDAQGRDGSFMRLFRYISGDNQRKEKIAMTTPVFMEESGQDQQGTMAFVMPKDLSDNGVPGPIGEGVQVKTREGGRFAVIRFSGQLNSESATRNQQLLREWIEQRQLVGEPFSESAGYDPPYTPGPLRRNEVLIRLRSSTTPSVKESIPSSGAN
ncbi:MAG: heme-binding protein [Planctomycetota bacterium]